MLIVIVINLNITNFSLLQIKLLIFTKISTNTIIYHTKYCLFKILYLFTQNISSLVEAKAKNVN